MHIAAMMTILVASSMTVSFLKVFLNVLMSAIVLGYACFIVKEGTPMSQSDMEQLPVSVEPPEDDLSYDVAGEARMPLIVDMPRARRALFKAEPK